MRRFDYEGPVVSSFWDKFKHTLRTTSIEILILALIGGGIGFYLSFKAEKRREGNIPIGFSEISQIERDAVAKDSQLSELNKFLPLVNDFFMKIAESWNNAHQKKSTVPISDIYAGSEKPSKRTLYTRFAENLYPRMNIQFRQYHYELKDIVDLLPVLANAVIKGLSDYRTVGQSLPAVINNFDRAWDYDPDHKYKTEVRTRTGIDMDGNPTVEIYTEEVYSHTIHTYDYHQEYGNKASYQLTALVSKYPVLKLKKGLMIASETHEEGRRAAAESRRKKSPETEEEYRMIASIWRKGSTLKIAVDNINPVWPVLVRGADNWSSVKDNVWKNTNGKNRYRYRTNRRSNPGPKEYQVAETNLQNARQVKQNIDQMFQGINYVKTQIPLLEQKIKEIIDIEVERVIQGDSKKLTDDIISIAREMYELNFSKGFDVKGFRAGMVVLFSFLGIIAGIGLGILWDRLT